MQAQDVAFRPLVFRRTPAGVHQCRHRPRHTRPPDRAHLADARHYPLRPARRRHLDAAVDRSAQHAGGGAAMGHPWSGGGHRPGRCGGHRRRARRRADDAGRHPGVAAERRNRRVRTARLPRALVRLADRRVRGFGPQRGKEQTFALAADWLPPQVVLDRDEALRTLAQRFFRSHGPAAKTDFTGWTGLTATDTKAAIAMLGDELAEVSVAGRELLCTAAALDSDGWRDGSAAGDGTAGRRASGAGAAAEPSCAAHSMSSRRATRTDRWPRTPTRWRQ